MSPRPLIEDSFPVVLSGPTGAGKTTIRDRLLAADDLGGRLTFSVSMTTRERRPHEQDGVDYRFVDRADFDRRVEAGEMLEWAEVHGRAYGTPRSNLEAAAAQGKHLLLDIDVQGARQVRGAVPGALFIFLLPPDGDRVLERLRRRGSEDLDEIRRRFESAQLELHALPEFDYVVINDHLDQAVDAVRSIIVAEQHAIRRQQERVRRRADRLGREIAAELD